LIDYIQVKAPVYLPHTAGRFASKRFRKAQCPIVERLTNSLMMHGRNNGKKLMAVRIVKHAFEIIHLLSDQNPIQVLVDAIINTGPREDSTRIGSAGTVRRQAVDVSPLRRVNQAVSLLTIGVSCLSLVFALVVFAAGDTPLDEPLKWKRAVVKLGKAVGQYPVLGCLLDLELWGAWRTAVGLHVVLCTLYLHGFSIACSSPLTFLSTSYPMLGNADLQPKAVLQPL